MRCRSAWIALIRLATPAAVSRWPMLGLTEPMRRSRVRSVAWRKALASARRPRSDRRRACRCRAPRRSGWSPASTPGDGERLASRRSPGRRRSARGSRPCAAPSLLTAEPLITARSDRRRRARRRAGAARRRRRRCRAPCPRSARRRRGSGRRARGSRPRGRGSRRGAAPRSSTPPASAMSHSPRAGSGTREVHRDQRGRAGRLDVDARPAQVEPYETRVDRKSLSLPVWRSRNMPT